MQKFYSACEHSGKEYKWKHFHGQKENRKVISLLKVPLKNAIKKKPSAEGNKHKYLKENTNNNIDEYDFNVAFVMAHIIKY